MAVRTSDDRVTVAPRKVLKYLYGNKSLNDSNKSKFDAGGNQKETEFG
jgi:hypothetical protein